MHLSKVMMCIQRCKKVWSYYNRLSFGPLEGLPVTRNPWCIMEGHRIFYSPSFPLCLCLNFTHSGDSWMLRVLSTKVCFFLLLCLSLCWSLCLKSRLYLSLNGWLSSKTVLSLLLRGIFMDYIHGFFALSFWLGLAVQEATVEVCGGGRWMRLLVSVKFLLWWYCLAVPRFQWFIVWLAKQSVQVLL